MFIYWSCRFLIVLIIFTYRICSNRGCTLTGVLIKELWMLLIYSIEGRTFWLWLVSIIWHSAYTILTKINMYVSYIMKLRISHFISNTLENQQFDVQPIVCSFQSCIAISFIHTVDIATCFSYLYATFRLWVIKKWYKTCIINYVCQVESRLSSLTQWRSAKGSACELCMQTKKSRHQWGTGGQSLNHAGKRQSFYLHWISW